MFVNCILKHKKKITSVSNCLSSLEKDSTRNEKKNPLFVLCQAIHGSTYQVPIEIESAQEKALVVRWLLGASRKRSGPNMAVKLSIELVDVAKGSGNAIPKMVETHRMTKTSISFYTFSLIHEQSLYRQIDS
ncbi:hypothetical protein ACOSQ4_021595 [Xanthoceras sorbifolium]